MDSWKTWSTRLALAAALGGAVLSRDACLGGPRPRPDPQPAPTAAPTATAAADATPAPSAVRPEPAPASTFATPP